MWDPDKFKNSPRQIWLNGGSGNYLLAEFVNVDSNFLFFLVPFYPVLRVFLKPAARDWIEKFKAQRRERRFKLANCAKPLPLPSDSVDHILASHFVEHLYRNDAET